MKLFSLISVCLFAHLYLVHGQQCGHEFETFRNCMSAKDGTEPSTPQDIPNGSISEEIIDCFLNNNCNRPTLAGDQAAGYEVLMGALIKCSDEVKDEIKPKIQECMVNTQNIGPGFILHPDMIAPLPLTMPNPAPAPPAIVVASAAAQLYNDHVCPINVDKQTVRQCVDGVSRKFIPFDDKNCVNPLDVNFDLTKHCYNREACKTQMSATCKHDMENIRSYLCNCAKQTFPDKASAENLVKTFKSCISREGFGDSPVAQPAVTTFVQYAQRLVTNLMCLQAPDPCKPATQPPQPLPQTQK